MKRSVLFLGLLIANSAMAATIPDFLDKKEITNSEFKCLGEPQTYSKKDQKYVDMLWKETLTYLEGVAVALSTPDGYCLTGDQAIVQTNTAGLSGPQHMCIMDRRDMRNMVKHIHAVLANPDKAKACFGARTDVDWLYSPGGELEKNSPVAQWAKRTTFEEFFKTTKTTDKVRKIGAEFSKNFSKMVTGPEMKMPDAFPFDISANALPNLWAAAGWFPMYATDSERNKRNREATRGNYAYAEVMGHWGLLRIDEINGEKVGSEIGMTAEAVGTFYPFHNHATSEIYYTMTQPDCHGQFKNFALREDSSLIKTVSDNGEIREVEFDASVVNEKLLWASTSPENGEDFVYFHENTIHGFNYASCGDKPQEKAIVSVWARSDADNKNNDYGTTLLCESSERPNTPAESGENFRCDLTKTKY